MKPVTCRGRTPPALATECLELVEECLELVEDGPCRYEFKPPKADGTRAILFEPLELVKKLAAPYRTYTPLTQYNGSNVLGVERGQRLFKTSTPSRWSRCAGVYREVIAGGCACRLLLRVRSICGVDR